MRYIYTMFLNCDGVYFTCSMFSYRRFTPLVYSNFLAVCDPNMFTCNTHLISFVISWDFVRCFWKSW